MYPRRHLILTNGCNKVRVEEKLKSKCQKLGTSIEVSSDFG